MATGTEALEYYGLTVDQALQFIEANIGSLRLFLMKHIIMV